MLRRPAPRGRGDLFHKGVAMINADQNQIRVGIDVGSRSIGFAAIEAAPDGTPLRLLSIQSFIHDAGLDPSGMKAAITRRAVSGVARRTRRLIRRQKRRLQELDELITSLGWPIVNHEDDQDPHLPWRVRAALSDRLVTDPDELHRMLSIAVRHMARHRGWRSPYARVDSLLAVTEPSDQLVAMRRRVEALVGHELDPDSTPAELVVATLAVDPTLRLRQNPVKSGVLGGKLMQSDNVREIRKWFTAQGLPNDLFTTLVNAVFKAESPAGSAAERVGKDALPGQGGKDRALRASLVFQRYRIATLLGNLRVLEGGVERRLSADEMHSAMSFLETQKDDELLTWREVADHLDLPRSALRGTAKETADGERASARPPIMTTEMRMRACKIKPVKEWWTNASPSARELFIEMVGHGVKDLEAHADGPEIAELITNLNETELAELDKLKLPAGRVAYSRDSLERLTKRILDESLDLYEARRAEFGVSADWAPPADPIGDPLGNPAVDRVVKEVARWLMAVEAEFGRPTSVHIEHVREGFMSEKTTRERDRDMQKRYEANLKTQKDITEQLGTSGPVRASDVTRFLAIQRQHGQCLYCGDMVTYNDAEMDHIVPRAGAGSTNTRTNLVAACRSCNHSKSKLPFAVWAARNPRPGVTVAEAVQRVKNLVRDAGMSLKDFKRFQGEVIARLTRTAEDPEIDARSLESVAWMARELRHRISAAMPGTSVQVFRGGLTAEARHAGEIQGQLPFIGGGEKTRLDRRHHAIDAAVVAYLRPAVAKTLRERQEIRFEQRLTRRDDRSWRDHLGSSPQLMLDWKRHMGILRDLLTEALVEDRIPVRNNVRLRLGNGSAHDDTIRALHYRKVGDELPMAMIDRASTPALWCALTRHPDFVADVGLPASETREIKVNGKKFGPGDDIGFFPSAAASIAVRGGSAEIGGTIHHARIYRIHGKKPTFAMVRVFAVDLQRYRDQDLFSAPLPPQSISIRSSEPKLRKALADGTAEYLGWLVVGDELLLDMSKQTSGDIGSFMKVFPEANRWRLAGFYSNARLRLRPVQIAAEGLANLDDASPYKVPSAQVILDQRGWRPSMNVVFGSCKPVIVRRDALGRPRLKSASNLPLTWAVQ